jgi:hypothetical protein
MWMEVVRLYPYTRWPTECFETNLRRLFVRRVRRITDEALKPMLSSLLALKIQESMDATANRNKELRWLGVAVRLLAERQPEEVRLRCVSAVPDLELRGGTKAAVSALKKGAMNEHERTAITNAMTKRSGVFRDSKAKILVDTKAGCEDLKQDVARVEAEWQVRPRVQNRGALEPQIDKKRLVGDAELARTPWSVDGSAPDLERLYRWCLVGGPPPGAVAVKEDKSLKSIPGSSKACALLAKPPRIGSIGPIGALGSDDLLRRCIEVFVERWREGSVDVENYLVHKIRSSRPNL